MRPAVFRHAPLLTVQIRVAKPSDLDDMNRIIERAVMQWPLAARVKRLSLACLRYGQEDMVHDRMWVAEDGQGTIVGLAVCTDTLDDADLETTATVLLHGLYVDPAHQRRGVGTQLLRAVQTVAQRAGVLGIGVKAHAGAREYFLANGWMPVFPHDTGRGYPHRYWLNLSDKWWEDLPSNAGSEIKS